MEQQKSLQLRTGSIIILLQAAISPNRLTNNPGELRRNKKEDYSTAAKGLESQESNHKMFLFYFVLQSQHPKVLNMRIWKQDSAIGL